ncbi:MAG: hypothetical protein ACJAY7_000574 [Pseudohongiellaceae bacterium]|jgi:hypothetical protein
MHLCGQGSLVLRRWVYGSGCGVIFSEFSAERGERAKPAQGTSDLTGTY